MKILHVNTLFTPRRFGGAEVFLERLAMDQVKRGHEVLVACLSPTPTSHCEEQLQVHEFSMRNIYWPFDGGQHPRWQKAVWHLRNSYGRGGARDIEGLVQQVQPDVVHTHNLAGFTSAVWQTIHRQGVAVVHTLHDYALLCPATTMHRRGDNCASQCLTCRLISWPRAGHSQAVDAVIGCSRFVLERHLASGMFARASHHVIHSGDPHAQQAAAPRLSTSQRLRVGYLGRLAPAKGVEFMLEALTPTTTSLWDVIIAGTGDDCVVSPLRARYESRGARFVGHVNAGEFLSDLDVLVVPSLWNEPFGLVVREAMNHGVPVIGAAVGGIPESIDHGRCGYLFKSGDADALRSHVTALATDRELHRAMSHRCITQAKHNSFSRTVDGYLDVYQEAMN